MNAQSKVEPPTLAKLREPFAPNHISKLPKPTKQQTEAVRQNFKAGVRCKDCGAWHHPDVVHLDYVGHAALTDRLLDTDPEWMWEPAAVDERGLPAFDKNGGLWIKLTVLGVTRLGYGSADGKQGGDAIKEIIGDALRNAAMRFGAALDLWHKGDLHAGPDDEGEQSTNSHDSRINEAQLAKLKHLLDATKTDEVSFLRGMKAPADARLFQLPESMFNDAVDLLDRKLAKMAKAETNAKGRDWNTSGPPPREFADVDESDVPF